MKTLHLKTKSINRPSLRLGLFLILVLLVGSVVLPTQKALGVSPEPDGGYANFNTAEGAQALEKLTGGGSNTAIGFNALFSDTTGSFNTATGSDALVSNTTGTANTANGTSALESNNGSNNTATGFNALTFNTTGFSNTATGSLALEKNTTGRNNTATGLQALLNNNGTGNTATGLNALRDNTGGSENTANGTGALFFNNIGSDNTADGMNALENNTIGNSNIALGFQAGAKLTTGNNNIDIGNGGTAGESNTIRMGTVGTQTATFIAGVSGVAVTGTPVVVNSSGQLGVAPSSARFKDEIKAMDKASEAILALKPVTFRYKHELDPDGVPQFGLVAEQVEKVNPDLVVRDQDGKVNSVRYEAVNAMLLNEFLKEHRKVEEQQKEIAALAAQLKKQAAFIQKVSDKLEASKRAPQLGIND